MIWLVSSLLLLKIPTNRSKSLASVCCAFVLAFLNVDKLEITHLSYYSHIIEVLIVVHSS